MDPVFIKQERLNDIEISFEITNHPLDDFNIESFLLQGSACGYSFGSMGGIINHKCSNCGAIFPKPATNNTRNDVNGRMISSVCSECYEAKKRAAEQQLLSLHSKNYEKSILRQYPSIRKPTGCAGCSALAKMRNNYKTRAVATEMNEMDRYKLVTCLVCGAKILGRTMLNAHMKKHFDEGVTRCETCRENDPIAVRAHDYLIPKKKRKRADVMD